MHGALFSLKLENGSIDRFLSEMEQLGLTQEKEGCYNPVFTFYDQGYSLVEPGLRAMNSTAKTLRRSRLTLRSRGFKRRSSEGADRSTALF